MFWNRSIHKRLDRIDDKLNGILALARIDHRLEVHMSVEMDNLKAGVEAIAVTANDIKTVEASAEAVLAALVAKQADLQAQLQAAIDAGNPTDIQTAADTLAAQNLAIKDTTAKLAAAIANIPA